MSEKFKVDDNGLVPPLTPEWVILTLDRELTKTKAQLGKALNYMEWVVDLDARGWTNEVEFGKAVLEEIKAIGM